MTIDTEEMVKRAEVAKKRQLEQTLYARDVANLPKYDSAAISLRPSPIAIANGSRLPNNPPPARVDDPEHLLRQAQLDVYTDRQAVNQFHSYDYDPCRSR